MNDWEILALRNRQRQAEQERQRLINRPQPHNGQGRRAF